MWVHCNGNWFPVNATIPVTFPDAAEPLRKLSDILALRLELALLEKEIVLDASMKTPIILMATYALNHLEWEENVHPAPLVSMDLVQPNITVATMNTRQETGVVAVVQMYTKTTPSIFRHANFVADHVPLDLPVVEIFQVKHAQTCKAMRVTADHAEMFV